MRRGEEVGKGGIEVGCGMEDKRKETASGGSGINI